MNQYIPRISRGTLDSTYQSIIEDDGEVNFDLIKEENPNVLVLVHDVMNSDLFNADFREGFCKGINSLYRLINSQMQSDDMRDSQI